MTYLEREKYVSLICAVFGFLLKWFVLDSSRFSSAEYSRWRQ